MKINDQQVIEGILQGLSNIYDYLQKKYYPWCRNFVVLHNDREENAQELFNDSYMKVREIISLQKFELTAETKFRTYFCMVFINLWLNRKRTEMKHGNIVPEISVEELFSKLPPADADLLKHEMVCLMEAYVRRLNEPCRTYIHLHYTEEYGYEIMKDLLNNKSISSIKQELHRNLVHLRSELIKDINMKTQEELYYIFDNYLKGKLDHDELDWFVNEYHSNPQIKEEYDVYLKIVSFLKEDLSDNLQVTTLFSKEIIEQLVARSLQNPELAPLYKASPLRENLMGRARESLMVRGLRELPPVGRDLNIEEIACVSPYPSETSVTGYIYFNFIFKNITDLENKVRELNLELKIFDNRHLAAFHDEQMLKIEGNSASLLYKFLPGLYYWYFYMNKRLLFDDKFYVFHVDMVGEVLKKPE